MRRERRLPGEIGYEPAGIFTPDLREVDHYRYHDKLLPQIIGHTASKNGEIRYSPGSWLQRDYIAIDVGRQHGTGNGGLLLTDFGWVAVTPGGPARLVEVGPLFVRLAHEAAAARGDRTSKARQTSDRCSRRISGRRSRRGDRSRAIKRPSSWICLRRRSSRWSGSSSRSGRRGSASSSPTWTRCSRRSPAATSNTARSKCWRTISWRAACSRSTRKHPSTGSFTASCRPLINELGPRSRLLANVLLVVAGGNEIYVFQDGAYRLVSKSTGNHASEGFDALVKLSREGRLPSVPEIDPEKVIYLGDSSDLAGLDHAMAGRVGIVINVGDAMLEMPGQSIINLHRGYLRTIDVIIAASAALHESGRAKVPESPPEVGDTVLWTFEQKCFRRQHRASRPSRRQWLRPRRRHARGRELGPGL